MENEKSLQSLFEEAIERKNLSYQKISELTNIPEKYILAIQNTELNKLPAFPYIRGYLKKICRVLELDFDNIWNTYKKELGRKTSGAFDKLPTNRFAIQKINKKSLFAGVVFVILLAFFIINFNNFFGKPYLEVTSPKDSLTTTSESKMNLVGRIDPSNKLTINDKEVVTDFNGNFEYPYELSSGINTVKFTVKKLLGGENTQVKQIVSQASTTVSQ